MILGALAASPVHDAYGVRVRLPQHQLIVVGSPCPVRLNEARFCAKVVDVAWFSQAACNQPGFFAGLRGDLIDAVTKSKEDGLSPHIRNPRHAASWDRG